MDHQVALFVARNKHTVSIEPELRRNAHHLVVLPLLRTLVMSISTTRSM